jgi:hypothetical protein
MRESLLGQIFFSLSDDDRKALHQVLHTRHFNSRKEVVRLIEFMEKYTRMPDKSERGTRRKPLNKEEAYAWVFGEAELDKSQRRKRTHIEYDDGKMRHLMSYTLETIRLFLAWDSWKSSPENVALHLCKSLKKRGLGSLFEKDYQRTCNLLNTQEGRSADYYYQHFCLESDAWEIYRAGQRQSEHNFQLLSASFGNYVAINTLRQGCSIISQKNINKNQVNIPYLQETIRLVEEGHFTDAPAVQIYYYCYKALVQPDDEIAFTAIKTHLASESTIFPDDELRDIFILAINFCIRRLNTGQKHYIQEAFNLYRLGLTRKVFLENSSLSPFTYRNILNLAMALGEWDWALQYLHEFAPYLPAKNRDNIFRYTLATYYFRLPDYEKTLELIRQVEFRDTLFNFDARRMLLRIYYDRQEFQALESLLESFYLYLQRHTDVGYHYEMYSNLVRYAKRLLKIRPDETDKWERLRNDITQTKHVAERDWLLSLIP